MRVAAKELTSLIIDEERLRAERSDRKSWKSRVTGLEEHAPPHIEGSNRRPNNRRNPANDEEDAEYRLALEASKYQEEEDRKNRESRQSMNEGDDDLAKAIQLSQEEDERRRRELEENNANALFGEETPQASQPQPTGFNQGYQQGNQVDFFANPVEQNQMQPQPTGFMQNAYTGFQPNQTGYPNYQQGFGMQQTGMGQDPYGQQSMPQFQQQPTGYNPYAMQQNLQQNQPQNMQASEPAPQPGSNNPWATNQSQQQQSMKPTPTGSNNPFAQFNRPQASQPMQNLSALPEQKTLNNFNQPQQQMPQPAQPQQFNQQQPPPPQPQLNQPRKEMNEHETRLNALLSTGDGMDTYGNTGDLRIPSQHTAPGMFMNSAGSGSAQLQADATGNNPFLRQQFTGMPAVSYGGQQGMNGQGSNNPFGAQQPQRQQQNPGQDLIQF